MRHPKYQIVQVSETNGVRKEEVVSKELMFKCDAERVTNYYNRTNSCINKNGNGYWYIVREYKRGGKCEK